MNPVVQQTCEAIATVAIVTLGVLALQFLTVQTAGARLKPCFKIQGGSAIADNH